MIDRGDKCPLNVPMHVGVYFSLRIFTNINALYFSTNMREVKTSALENMGYTKIFFNENLKVLAETFCYITHYILTNYFNTLDELVWSP